MRLPAELISRINTRHFGLTKHARTSSTSSSASTPTFPLPLPPGAALPTSHLSTKDAQALTKIQAEWGKVEALQEEKIKLAERIDRIVNRARERGKAEWIKIGGMDLDELGSEQAKAGMYGEMGNGEIMLPPGGLGSGSDGRHQKSRLTFLEEAILSSDLLFGRRTETQRPTPPTTIFRVPHDVNCPPTILDAASTSTDVSSLRPLRSFRLACPPPSHLPRRPPRIDLHHVGNRRGCGWRGGSRRTRRWRGRRHAVLHLSAEELR